MLWGSSLGLLLWLVICCDSHPLIVLKRLFILTILARIHLLLLRWTTWNKVVYLYDLLRVRVNLLLRLKVPTTLLNRLVAFIWLLRHFKQLLPLAWRCRHVTLTSNRGSLPCSWFWICSWLNRAIFSTALTSCFLSLYLLCLLLRFKALTEHHY